MLSSMISQCLDVVIKPSRSGEILYYLSQTLERLAALVNIELPFEPSSM